MLHGGFDPLATGFGKRCKREPYVWLELAQEGQGILHRGWIAFHKQFFEEGVQFEVLLACRRVISCERFFHKGRHFAWNEIGGHTDHAHGANAHKGKCERVVAGENFEGFRKRCAQLADAFYGAARLFDGDDIRVLLRKRDDRFNANLDATAARNAVEHDGKLAGFGDGRIVREKACLRGFVVIWGDDECCVGSESFRLAGQIDRFTRRIGTRARDDFASSFGGFYRDFNHAVVFLMVQSRRFAGRSHGNDSVNAAANLSFDEPHECGFVEVILEKRRHQGRVGAFKHRARNLTGMLDGEQARWKGGNILLLSGRFLRFVVSMATDPAQALLGKVLTVSELTANVRKTLESSIGQVCVEGEVSNYRMQASGHQYFTLKDAKAQLACVWFAGRFSGNRTAPLAEGMAVQVRGMLTVFEAQGKYQVNVQSVQASGTGLLQAKFDALKRRLQEEGLFDRARKRALPAHPATVALVTSPTGSVVQDMLKVLGRRAPWVRVLVYPVRVQGQTAAAEIAEAIRFLNKESGVSLPVVDVIIAGRGGGSVEDLWCFNEEVLARAIFESAIPLVSAVGHETDFTIADFVADFRAPTPSVAAETVVPDGIALRREIRSQSDRMETLVHNQLQRWQQRLESLERSALFREPRARLAEASQRVDATSEDLQRALQDHLGGMRRKVEVLAASVRAHRPDQVLALKRQQIEAVHARLERVTGSLLVTRRGELERLRQKLVLLSPEGTLERGYSIALSEEGGLIRSVSQVRPGMKIVTRLRDGRVESVVE